MKITGIETFQISSPLERPFGRSQNWIDHRGVNLVKVSTDEGIVLNPHVWGSPVMIAASLHVAATLPPCPPSGTPEPFVQEPVM